MRRVTLLYVRVKRVRVQGQGVARDSDIYIHRSEDILV